MTKELTPIIIRVGEKINLANKEGATIQIANSKTTIYQIDDAPANHGIKTIDFPEGKYSIVISQDDELVSIQELTVIPVFIKQTKKEFLRETINLIDEVITARLSNDEAALSQMSIKGNTFAYESLSVLAALKDSYSKELAKLIKNERRKQGISPIKNIKIRLTR